MIEISINTGAPCKKEEFASYSNSLRGPSISIVNIVLYTSQYVVYCLINSSGMVDRILPWIEYW